MVVKRQNAHIIKVCNLQIFCTVYWKMLFTDVVYNSICSNYHAKAYSNCIDLLKVLTNQLIMGAISTFVCFHYSCYFGIYPSSIYLLLSYYIELWVITPHH